MRQTFYCFNLVKLFQTFKYVRYCIVSFLWGYRHHFENQNYSQHTLHTMAIRMLSRTNSLLVDSLTKPFAPFKSLTESESFLKILKCLVKLLYLWHFFLSYYLNKAKIAASLKRLTESGKFHEVLCCLCGLRTRCMKHVTAPRLHVSSVTNPIICHQFHQSAIHTSPSPGTHGTSLLLVPAVPFYFMHC